MSHYNSNVKSLNIADKKKIVQKLHTQFAYPPANKLIKLIEEGFKDDEALQNEIKNMSGKCGICIIYRRPNLRPFAGLLSIATESNEIIAIDLKEFKGKLVLHVTDHTTRFSAANFVASKHREQNISVLLKI